MPTDETPPNLLYLFEKLKEGLPAKVSSDEAAARLAMCLQNIYTDMHLDNSDTRQDLVSRSFKLREYAELYMGRYMNKQVICGLYNYIQKKGDWNGVVHPANWGIICYQNDIKQTVLMFLSMALQNFIVDNSKDLGVLQLQGKPRTVLDNISEDATDQLEP